MNLTWSDSSWDDYLYWNQTDKQLFKKINTLIKEIKRTPFEGTGKPEPLKYELAGCWSRRLNHEHRLVYEVTEQGLFIVSCKYHY